MTPIYKMMFLNINCTDYTVNINTLIEKYVKIIK